ncbi:hypothetical protein N9H96_01375 [Porticoccaceae bacterium]|jgi:hypothetical protein|nr:hypothetical protein [Porticoccaceae bacterium]MDA8885396.1 hypothetical protein [Porticoccaceae bacterium]
MPGFTPEGRAKILGSIGWAIALLDNIVFKLASWLALSHLVT